MFAFGRAKGHSKDVLKADSQCLQKYVLKDVSQCLQKDVLRTF